VAEISDGRDGARIKFHSKPQAIETLARHLSMFKDNIDINVNVSLADLVNGSYRLERGELQIVDGQMTEPKQLPARPNKSEELPSEPNRSDNAHHRTAAKNGTEQGQ
jgi:hypothetical protein